MMQAEPRERRIQQAIRSGVDHHQAGRLPEAERCYLQALQIDPKHVPAMHLLAGVAHQSGRNDACVQWLDRALAIQPDSAEALGNRGFALYALGRFEEALASCDRALALVPGYADALNVRGAVLHELRRYEESIVAYDRLLSLAPGHVAALSNRGNSLQKLRQHAQALASYDRALAIAPDFVAALSNRGLVLHALGRHEEALAAYDRALALGAGSADALSGRGLVLMELKRHDEALASCDQALAIDPDSAEAHCNRGLVLKALGRLEEALATFDKALAIRPAFAEALNNRGIALHDLDRHEEAIASYDRALAADAGFALPWANRGFALNELGRYREAMTSYDRALALDPEYAEAHVNQSLCRLSAGDYAEGWEQYEWRWRYAKFNSPRRDFRQPLWRGEEALRGKTILLHAEQGLGDTLQFVRYVPEVARRGAKVILEVQPRLKRLLSGIDGALEVVAYGEPLPGFDLHCPLLSLPLAFRTRLESIPAQLPYLKVPPALLDKWTARLPTRDALRVGISWSGNPGYGGDRKRSIALEKFASLQSSALELVSLQKDLRAGDEQMLAARGIAHFGAEQEDFGDAAALVARMDLVIAVNSSIAHLAGALGKPVWVLVPYSTEWRWLIDRDDSPWYPTARLFRQARIGDWDGVFDAIGRRLAGRESRTDKLP